MASYPTMSAPASTPFDITASPILPACDLGTSLHTLQPALQALGQLPASSSLSAALDRFGCSPALDASAGLNMNMSTAGLVDPLQQQVALLQVQQVAALQAQQVAQAAAAEQLLPLLNLGNLLAVQGLSTGEVAELLALKQALQQSSGRASGGSHIHGTGPVLNPLFKTELCRSWEETGSCRYGAKCQFAHGREELRPVQRHPKYKTEICRTFAATGICPYGTRCRFIHNFSTARNTSSSSAKGAVTPPRPAPACVPYTAPGTPTQHETPLAISIAPGTPSSPSPFATLPVASPTLSAPHTSSPVLPQLVGFPAMGATPTPTAVSALTAAAMASALLAPSAPSPTIASSYLPSVAAAPIGLAGLNTPNSAVSLTGSGASHGSGPATPKSEQGGDPAVRRSFSESGQSGTPSSSRRLPIFSRLVEEECSAGALAGVETATAAAAALQ